MVNEINREAERAAAGMSGVTRPFRITRIMTNSLAAFSA